MYSELSYTLSPTGKPWDAKPTPSCAHRPPSGASPDPEHRWFNLTSDPSHPHVSSQFEGTPDFLSLRKKWKQEALSRLGAARGGAAQKRVSRVV